MPLLKTAFRQLLKSPGFSFIVILIIALGIGANTAIFSVVHAILLRPPGYPQADRIMVLNESRPPQFPIYPVSGANFLDWQRNLSSFEVLGATRKIFLNYSGTTEPVRIQAQRATTGFFTVFGLQPMLGRLFTPEEDVPGHNHVALLSYGLWQSLLAGDPAAIGRSLRLNGENYEIVGVMPPEFQKGDTTRLWVPMAFTDSERSNEQRATHFLDVYGRLKPGVTRTQAFQEMETLNRELQRLYPDTNKSCFVRLISLADHYSQDVRRVLQVLFGCVVCVLLIVCLNVANLLFVRGTARKHEIAIRLSLGASRRRLVGQLLGESLILFLGGGALGVALASAALTFLVRLIPANLPQAHLIGMHLPVLAFSLGLSLLTGVVFSLLPAWQATRVDLQQAIKDGARGTAGGRRSRLHAVLVAFEVAAALMLLIAATLLGRSFARLHNVDIGLVPDHAVMMSFSLPAGKYSKPEEQVAFVRNLLDRLSAAPGVTAAGVTQTMPLVRDWVSRLIVENRPPVARGDLPNTNYYTVTPDYFRAMGIPLLRGRFFTEHDDASSRRVAIINETFARQYFPGEDPVGKRIKIDADYDGWRVIVGIVHDVRSAGLDHEVIPQSYEPYLQQPYENFSLIVRTEGDTGTLAATVRKTLAEVDRDQPATTPKPLNDIVAESLARQRFAVVLVGGFSLLALFIATIGIYGAMSYRVIQQTREMGVRLALGAQPAALRRLVLAEGLKIIFCGLAAGTLASFAVARVLQSLLYEMSSRDPATFAMVACVLAAAGLLACWLPARRATRVDPLIALRSE